MAGSTPASPPVGSAFAATNLGQVAHLIEAWDDLAVAAGNPYATPAWVLAWWRHAAPNAAALRLLVVTDEDGLVGVGPFFATKGRGGVMIHGVIGATTAARSTLVAHPGKEGVAARHFARLLSNSEPAVRVVTLAGVPDDALHRAFLDEMSQRFPGLHIREDFALPAPVIRLDHSSFDEWYASKSRNFRQQTRRRRRQLDSLGGDFRAPGQDDELRVALADFAALHHSRWQWRGGSAVLTPGVEAALLEAAQALAPTHRFRLWALEVAGKTIASMAFFSAGDELAWWLGGFDEAWSKYQPGIATLVAAIEDAFEQGNTRLTLGAGGQEMKRRFADDAETLAWLTISTRPEYRFLAWMQQRFGLRLRLTVASRLSEPQRHKLRKIARRVNDLRTPRR